MTTCGGLDDVRRQLRTGTVTTLVIALLGAPLGLLWQMVSPPVKYIVLAGQPVLADPETQALISVDGHFAVLTGLAGVLCGVVAYLIAGRVGSVGLVVGLALGGTAAAFLAWRAGHYIGLGTFQRLVDEGKDGTVLTGVADLQAMGVLMFWPIAAAGLFGLLEAIDVAGRHRPAAYPPSPFGDGDSDGGNGSARPSAPHQVDGGQFDPESTPLSWGEHHRR